MSDSEPNATPAATAHAEASGVDLSQVEGTGAGGKVTKADVTAHAAAADTAEDAPEAKASKAPKVDQYYAVKTGDTFDRIAKELGHDGEGQALLDASHGGPTNGEQAASHLNLVSGADGEATDNEGRLIPLIDAKTITTKTKLVEGQSLLLPEGW